jgi:hypothetical protein
VKYSCTLALGLLASVGVCAWPPPQGQKDPNILLSKIHWGFKTWTDKKSNPNTMLFLCIGPKPTQIAQVTDTLADVPKGEFRDAKIPTTALIACRGWWAGQGDIFYTLKKGSNMLVYREELDEQSAHAHFKLVKTVPLPKGY